MAIRASRFSNAIRVVSLVGYGSMGYITHMKTTIDIADSILIRAKAIATREKMTLRELTEEGLRAVIERHEQAPTYTAQPVVFDGNGLTDRYARGNWDRIREEIYEGGGE